MGVIVYPKRESATVEDPSFLYGAIDLPPIPGVLVHIDAGEFTTATHAGRDWYLADGGSHWVLGPRIDSPKGRIVGDKKDWKLIPKE